MKLSKAQYIRQRAYMRSANKYLQHSNFVNTLQVIADSRRNEQTQAFNDLNGIGRCWKSGLECTDFMQSNPDGQLRFAEEMGLFPEVGI